MNGHKNRKFTSLNSNKNIDELLQELQALSFFKIQNNRIERLGSHVFMPTTHQGYTTNKNVCYMNYVLEIYLNLYMLD